MLLLLIRHAEAEPRDAARWPDDAARPLVGKGRRRQRRMSRRLRRRGIVPDVLLASPWARAWETAEIVSDVVGCPPPVPCEALAGPPDLGRLADVLGPREPDAVVALVGHDPWISELASLLLTGTPSGLAVDFPKSGILGIRADRLEPGAGTLLFFWRPRRA
ncbi:MAG TPA: histidine phosphatase family protein [Gemmatimonadales bacterium]|jgi:phosphohistidine phosphatase|nr:histidine phosphatase family protein [Gemmatimonadales bacterium]